MIVRLTGSVAEVGEGSIVLERDGVGYEVLIPLSSFEKLPPPGQEVRLLTHLAVREDAHVLYGFSSAAERELFRLLITSVSGVGPRIALNILSGMTVASFRGAVAQSDVKSLSKVSGVGRKTAERIVVELKDKVGATGAMEASSEGRTLSEADQKLNDASLALVALGFKQTDAQESVRKAVAMLGDTATVEDLVRACLKKDS